MRRSFLASIALGAVALTTASLAPRPSRAGEAPPAPLPSRADAPPVVLPRPEVATGAVPPDPPATPALVRLTLPPPDSMRDRPPLLDTEYARKKEGRYFTGLPLANSDPTSGLGFGARVYFFDNGHRDDRRFGYTPYLHRVFAQAFFSTKGLQFHWLDYDAPLFADSSWRLRAALIVGRNTSQNYFGRGERSMGDLTYSGAGRTFARASDYTREIERILPGGQTRSHYDKYDLLRPSILLGTEKLLLGGRLRPFVGLGFSYNRVHDYTGEDVVAPSTGGRGTLEVPELTTRLREDCDRGLLVGCDGGWENVLRLAVVYDTRDFEPDPNRGIMAEVSGELGSKLLGSDFTFARVLTSVRGFWSPAPRLADVVLAGRLLYQVQSTGTPFFSQNILPFSEDFRLGLGGVRTLRGYQQDRFVGNVMAVANAEV
ncbi:MAG: hypothetical protein EOO75_14585, partial [Myxococcales bacterium]